MVQRLPDTSMTAALVNGGKEMFGWGVDRHMQADIFDALNLNTRATGNFKKPPKIPEWPRPNKNKVEKKSDAGTNVSVADLYKKFQGGKPQ